ncbi:hypothetical protein [Chitinivorax sp. B]|uniref:hypothetical protein n=1 Tax=Chitinivorax sp. B TaxID=2502235 RepID=UPI0010F95CE6|nr:hypothetical protein [Chitinivorax sp. B]
MYFVGGTGAELSDFPLTSESTFRELRVLLMNPYCEQLKRYLYAVTKHPRAAAEQIHLELLLGLSALKRWAQMSRFQLNVRLYDALPSQKMQDVCGDRATLKASDAIWCPAFWASSTQQLEAAWEDPCNLSYKLETRELIQFDSTGRLTRKIDVSQPPRLPYFDDDGALVVSI